MRGPDQTHPIAHSLAHSQARTCQGTEASGGGRAHHDPRHPSALACKRKFPQTCRLPRRRRRARRARPARPARPVLQAPAAACRCQTSRSGCVCTRATSTPTGRWRRVDGFPGPSSLDVSAGCLAPSPFPGGLGGVPLGDRRCSPACEPTYAADTARVYLWARRCVGQTGWRGRLAPCSSCPATCPPPPPLSHSTPSPTLCGFSESPLLPGRGHTFGACCYGSQSHWRLCVSGT